MATVGSKRLEAEFLCSALSITQCPHWERVEIALAGRSNVGKSSLLNALAGRKNLARISKTPGRTRCLNFFTIGKHSALVDLPGYGYAKMSHSEAGKIAFLMEQYLRQRHQLRALLLLVDARRGPQDEELGIAETFLDSPERVNTRLRLLVVATKCDKLTRNDRQAALRRFEPMGTAPIMCSAATGEGIDQLRHELIHVTHPDSADATDSAL